LVNETELPSFEAVIEKITRLRDRMLPEVLMIVAVYCLPIFSKTELLMSGISSWHAVGDGSGVSLANTSFSNAS
jgi:hypothetical protein